MKCNITSINNENSFCYGFHSVVATVFGQFTFVLKPVIYTLGFNKDWKFDDRTQHQVRFGHGFQAVSLCVSVIVGMRNRNCTTI